jgi:SAM-dependent methyltransferase
MTSRHGIEGNLESEATPYKELLASAEAAYDRLTGYGFVRQHVEGKVVADVGREDVGYGSRLLAETAESVTALSTFPEALELASSVYSAPNMSYRRANLPELPLSEGYFDVVVALGVIEALERPEDLVREAKRVLKEGGVLVVSALDRQTNTNERNRLETDARREMYVPEFREMLERHFGHVRMYRQGAVAGGFVFAAPEEPRDAAPVEIARFSLTEPSFIGVEPPVTRSVIAVCGNAAEALGQEGRSYLLLDRDRRIFEECEERGEDVELLRAEIGRMQETEIRVFVEALNIEVLPLSVLLRLASHVLLSYLYSYFKANLQEVRQRRELTLEEALHRRDLTLEAARHRRRLVFGEVRHRRNLVLERIRHRRNIIHGNIYAVRQKGPRGMAEGAFRRSYLYYQRLRTKYRSSN